MAVKRVHALEDLLMKYGGTAERRRLWLAIGSFYRQHTYQEEGGNVAVLPCKRLSDSTGKRDFSTS
jgi:hypothetical protein